MSKKNSQRGVTAIEYALLTALIAIALLGALSATGQGNEGLWDYWSSRFIEAIGAAIGS